MRAMAEILPLSTVNARDYEKVKTCLEEIPDSMLPAVLEQVITMTPFDVMESFIRQEIKVSEEEKAKMVDAFRSIYLLVKKQ
jgi:hypothetical protein